MSTEYYCPEHRYSPPENSGFALCPQCELAPARGSVCLEAKYNVLTNEQLAWFAAGG